MKKIIIWHQGALGDLLLSLPAVYAIKRYFAPCRLHLIAGTDLAGLIMASGIADEVSSNEKATYADFFREDPLPAVSAALLRSMYAAFIFLKRENPVLMENFRRHVPFCENVSTVPPQGKRMHISAFQLRRLKIIGIPSFGTPRLFVKRAAFGGRRSLITVHPGSGGKWKRWDLGGFLDVMEVLAREREGLFRFAVLLGPAEMEMKEECDRFIAARDIPADVVVGRPATYIASLLTESSLFLGNDSGVTHLASMMGVPTIAVFGPTDPAIWGPLGEDVRIVLSDPPCLRCRDHQDRTCAELSCLRDVRPQDVLKAARGILSRGTGAREGSGSLG